MEFIKKPTIEELFTPAKVSIEGFVHLELINKFGDVVDERFSKNAFVNGGANNLVSIIDQDPIAGSTTWAKYVQLGSKGTTLTAAMGSTGLTSFSVASDIIGTSYPYSIVLGVGTANAEVVSVTAKSGTGPYTYTCGATTKTHSASDSVCLAIALTDTALGTAIGASATAGTLSGSTNVWTNTCTITPGSAFTAYEAGIFSASTSGIMIAHTIFAAINGGSSDSVKVTWDLTFAGSTTGLS